MSSPLATAAKRPRWLRAPLLACAVILTGHGCLAQSTTTPLPTDIPSIVDRIQLMQTQLDALSAQATQVQQGIDQAAAAAVTTDTGMSLADQNLAYVTATAR